MYNKPLDYLLSNNPDDVVSRKGVKFRKRLYSLLRILLKIANPYKLHIIREAKLPENTLKIFTPTHGFKDDLLNATIIAKEHAYILFRSVDHFYNSLSGYLAHIMGVCVVDRDDPLSRAAIIPKMVKAMNYGTNALVFPEGAWNLTDNELVMKLFPGFYNLAKLTDAMIVPIGIHAEGKNCYAIKDEGFYITDYTQEEARQILRDKLASLKYELMEKYSTFTRTELEDSEISLVVQWEEHKRYLKNQTKYYIEEKEANYPYKDKSIVEYEEAFAHLNSIEITRDNAFLLRTSRTL